MNGRIRRTYYHWKYGEKFRAKWWDGFNQRLLYNEKDLALHNIQYLRSCFTLVWNRCTFNNKSCLMHVVFINCPVSVNKNIFDQVFCGFQYTGEFLQILETRVVYFFKEHLVIHVVACMKKLEPIEKPRKVGSGHHSETIELPKILSLVW